MVSPYVLIYLAAYIVPAIVGFFALILYTHLLSPAEYGVYVIGVSIASIVSAMCFSWIRQSVARYRRDRRSSICAPRQSWPMAARSP